MNPRLRSGLVVLLLLALFATGCTWPFGGGTEVPPITFDPLADFTVIVLPDTQIYSQGYPNIFNSQAEWIVDNAAQLNIAMVLHEGDVVNKGAKHALQWENARTALNKIDQAGIPLFIAIGNHDYDDEAVTRGSTFFNHYFGITRYQGQPWFGGAYRPNESQNVYGYIEAGDRQYLVLVLEFGPRKEVVDWANQVVANHPEHEVILLTHNHLTRTGAQSTVLSGSRTYGVEVDSHNGKQLWDELIRKHDNFILVLSGHVTGEASRRVDRTIGGNDVLQLMANYQFMDEGGMGYLRIMTFRPSEAVIEVQTYSPYLDAYMLDSKNNFTLRYDPITARNVLQMAY